VTETHIHADFVSGLAARAGRWPPARGCCLSGTGGPDWQYAGVAAAARL
jgi:hypothetical protein